MRSVLTTIVFGYVFILKSSCDEYMGEHVTWYPTLEFYKFTPRLGNCYEIYDSNQTVTPFTCRRPINPKNRACIHLITTDRYCLGLKTPTGETIQLLCEKSRERLLSYHADIELNDCFNVSKPDRSYKEVCQQNYDNYSIGITTPDIFTILFDSYFCATFTSEQDRKDYANFTNTYTFDPDTKSCFKIYEENQLISPYTCVNPEIFESCVRELPQFKGCEGIVTQNNETVILHCGGDTESSKKRNCFVIYTKDNNRSVVCQEKLEERCVGFTTPSNLTVLLECYYCSKPNIKYTSYNVIEQKKYRKFIKTYLSNEYLGKNSYVNKTEFATFKQNNSKPEIPNYLRRDSIVYGYWLPNSTCYGITLESNETVILKCISNVSKPLQPGCFNVINKNFEKNQITCVQILDEFCVGITTSSNWSVALDCYPLYGNSISPKEMLKENYLKKNTADEYRLYPGLAYCYEVYSPGEINEYSCRNSAHPENYACVGWIPGKNHCLGLNITKNETIEFVCGESPEDVLSYKTFSTIKNCFNIYKSGNKSGEVCQQNFGNYSVGLTAPSNYSILFDSFHCPVYKTPMQIQEYKDFIGNFSFDPSVRSCYKVFDPDQNSISPYTCLSEDIYDACTHPIENTDCMGITTQNGETIILDCSNKTTISGGNETGCFEIYTPDGDVQVGCHKQVEERCIGLVTPSNLTVLLECLNCFSPTGGSGLPVYTDDYRKGYRDHIQYDLYSFTRTNNPLENKTQISVYKPEQGLKLVDCYNEIKDYDIHVLPGHDHCKGITLDNLETVGLDCPGKIPEKKGCYDIFTPVFDKNNNIIAPERKVANVCVKILNEWCVGITTPKNWTIALDCFESISAVCSLVVIPNNGPPPRM